MRKAAARFVTVEEFCEEKKRGQAQVPAPFPLLGYAMPLVTVNSFSHGTVPLPRVHFSPP